MAQVKLNLALIRQVITFVMTTGNIILQVLDTIERSLTNG